MLHKNTKYKYNVQCGKRRDTLPQAASQQSFAFPWHGFVFFRFFCLSGFWAQFCILGAFQLRAGSCLIVVIWLDIIFIVCQIIMMIIYETECLNVFRQPGNPMAKTTNPAEHLQLNYGRAATSTGSSSPAAAASLCT